MTTTDLHPTGPAVPARLSGRPQLYRSYAQELALFNTRAKLLWVGVIIARRRSCCPSC